MSELCRRFRDDLTIRAEADGTGRTVFGLAVPFGVPTPIRDWQGAYTETFARGAFAKTIKESGGRVKLLAHHDTRMLLGGRPTLRETDDGLVIEAEIARTRDGDDVLELIRVGALDSFSVGFSPIKDGDEWSADGTEVIRRQVRLHEVSLVPFPAYETALVGGVRTTDPTAEAAGTGAAEGTADRHSGVNRNRIQIAKAIHDFRRKQ